MSRINERGSSQNPVDRACENLRRQRERDTRDNVRPLSPDHDLTWENQNDFNEAGDFND